jgi:hypothetical protein
MSKRLAQTLRFYGEEMARDSGEFRVLAWTFVPTRLGLLKLREYNTDYSIDAFGGRKELSLAHPQLRLKQQRLRSRD